MYPAKIYPSNTPRPPRSFERLFSCFTQFGGVFHCLNFDKFRETGPLDITGVSVPGNTFNWIVEDLEQPKLQTQRHSYSPLSASVALTMVRMKSFLHLVLVFLSCISYFSPDFNFTELLLKYHCKELSSQLLGLTPALHFNLTLRQAVSKTSRELICGDLGKRPVLDDKKI